MPTYTSLVGWYVNRSQRMIQQLELLIMTFERKSDAALQNLHERGDYAMETLQSRSKL